MGGVTTLTGITLASNFGTFTLYAMVCVCCIVAFKGRPECNTFKHLVLPAFGVFLNISMLLCILIIGIMSGGETAMAVYLAFALVAFTAFVGYFYWHAFAHHEHHMPQHLKDKMHRASHMVHGIGHHHLKPEELLPLLDDKQVKVKMCETIADNAEFKEKVRGIVKEQIYGNNSSSAENSVMYDKVKNALLEDQPVMDQLYHVIRVIHREEMQNYGLINAQ